MATSTRTKKEMSSRQPEARYDHAAVGIDDKLFVWAGDGGSTNIATRTLECFNVSSLTWEQPQQLIGSLPDGLCNMAVTSEGENVYTLGGYSKSGDINRVYEINPCTLLCRELLPNSSPHTPQKQDGSHSVCFQDKLVIYGGWTVQGRINDLHVFDLENSEWNIRFCSCIGCMARPCTTP